MLVLLGSKAIDRGRFRSQSTPLLLGVGRCLRLSRSYLLVARTREPILRNSETVSYIFYLFGLSSHSGASVEHRRLLLINDEW